MCVCEKIFFNQISDKGQLLRIENKVLEVNNKNKGTNHKMGNGFE